MKYLLILALLTSCSTSGLGPTRQRIRDCTEEFVEKGSGTKEAYNICKSLYSKDMR